jgi:hypothetical protein
MLSKPTLLCGDGRVCVHCHFDCHLQSDCRCDCSLGICQQKLDVTWFTWVTVAMSTHSGDRHRFGSLWVAFFGWQVWVLDIRLQAGWRSWVAQCTAEGARYVLVGLAPMLGVIGAPAHFYFGHFLSFPVMGLYSPRVSATQA